MNFLTFDLEEWFTYELYKKGKPSFYEPILEKYLNQILNMLDEKELSATFFCLGSIARSHPQIIKQIFQRGHDIGCHSDKHKFLTTLSVQEFRNDTMSALDSLEQCIGKKIIMYRAPAFTITKQNKWALEVLVESGIEIDSSIFSANRSYGGFPTTAFSKPLKIETNSGAIVEYPMNFTNILGRKIIYSGGGYFRLFPYPLLKKLFGGSTYNMSYFHLRDFDKYQKRILNHRYFYNYIGINSALDKLEKLINDFDFIPISQSEMKIEDVVNLKSL